MLVFITCEHDIIVMYVAALTRLLCMGSSHMLEEPLICPHLKSRCSHMLEEPVLCMGRI